MKIEMGQNWVYFVETKVETLLETGVSSPFCRRCFEKGAFLQSRDILLGLLPPFTCSFSDFWGFFHNSRAKKKKKKKRFINPCIFLFFLHLLPNSSNWVNFAVLCYCCFYSGIFFSSFMDPKGHFTCGITETLSYQVCVYPEQTSLIIFYLLQGSTHPNHSWCLDSHWLVWVSQLKENLQEQRQH